jgi:ribosomal protein L36
VFGNRVDNSSRSFLIRLRVFEPVSVKKGCSEYRLVKDQVRIYVLCISTEDVVKQKIQRAGVREDTFCPDSAVMELLDTPGVYVVDEHADMRRQACFEL